MQIIDTKIKIIKGDIAKLGVDVIVNPVHLKGAAVIKKAAGKLKARYVIHAPSLNAQSKTDEHSLRSATEAAIRLAEDKGWKSLGLPPIGCAEGGFSPVHCAKIMTQELLKLRRQKKISLKEVIFCLPDDKLYKIFKKEISAYLYHIQVDLGGEPYVCVDIIIERPEGIILIERSNPPLGWALPGGFLDPGESLEETARRETREETHLELESLRQFHTYSQMGRDPRFQTISTVFMAKGVGTPQFGDDAKGLKIVPYSELLKREYAFDHKEIVRQYLHSKKNNK